MSKFDYPEEVEQRHMDILDAVKGIDLARLRELAEAERENRLTVYRYPNCYACPRLPKTNIWQDDEPCKSCRERALSATEPKGDAT